MLMDYEEKSKETISDLSLELTVRNVENYINEDSDLETINNDIDQIIDFFEKIIDFCNKKASVMENGISGLEAFVFFVSALKSLDINVDNISTVKEKAKEYMDIFKKIKIGSDITPEKKDKLAKILKEINKQVDENINNIQANENEWSF